VNDGSTTPRARVLIGAAETLLREKLLAFLGTCEEFEVVGVCCDVETLLEAHRTKGSDLAIVDASVCRHGIGSDVEAITMLGLPVVVFTGRGSSPSVVELAGHVAVRAVSLPRWVLDHDDDLTAAHTRALLLDLTGRSTWTDTGEYESPADAALQRRRCTN
jgi:DNA-binding NarL/FixJ family response regulator